MGHSKGERLGKEDTPKGPVKESGHYEQYDSYYLFPEDLGG